jgi:hypothetical protein
MEGTDWGAALIGLAGVILGWGLTTFTESWNETRRSKRYREVLYLDLKDTHSKILTRELACEASLKEYVETRRVMSSPSQIDHRLFDRYFAEAASVMTEDERIAFAAIYEKIDSYNYKMDELQRNNDLVSSDPQRREDRKRVVLEVLLAAYAETKIISAQLMLMLEQRERLNLRSDFDRDAKLKKDVDQLCLDWATKIRAVG